LTAAGRRLSQFAESVEKQREQLRNDLDQWRDEVVGDLLIVSSTIPGEFILPPILAGFKALHPAVRAQVAVSDSLTVIEQVRDNSYEIGFCGIAPEEQGLEAIKIAEDEIALIVFPGHPFDEREEVSLAELEGEPFIFREETSGTQQNLERLLSRAGFDTRKWVPNLVLGSTQAVVTAVEAKAGIAFTSNLALKKSLALGLVRQISVREVRLRRDFYCIYRKGREFSTLLSEFIGFVRGEAVRDVKGK
jgi:DNA-binding transcriptional LysR family regulator